MPGRRSGMLTRRRRSPHFSLFALLLTLSAFAVTAFVPRRARLPPFQTTPTLRRSKHGALFLSTQLDGNSTMVAVPGEKGKKKKKVVVVGAGWGGLSATYELAKR